MTTEKKAKWIAGTVTGLFVLAMVSSVYFYNNGQSYRSQAESALLRQDSILSVKQLLDRELAEMRVQLEDAKGRNATLDQDIAAKENELRNKQEQIDKLVAQNATVQSLRNQLAQLKAEREQLNLRIQTLVTENQNLSADNQRLRNNVVALENEKAALQSKLNATDALANRAGNFRVDMLRKNDKVTSKAKRTHDIRVSFDLPANNSPETGGTKEVYLVVIDPQGKPVKDKSSVGVALNSGAVITPLETKTIDLGHSPQTVVMDVELESKVKSKGIYKIQVYTVEGQIGSSQIMMN